MKSNLSACRSRNPFVALAHRRHAGSHRPSEQAVRYGAERALQRELIEAKPPWR